MHFKLKVVILCRGSEISVERTGFTAAITQVHVVCVVNASEQGAVRQYSRRGTCTGRGVGIVTVVFENNPLGVICHTVASLRMRAHTHMYTCVRVRLARQCVVFEPAHAQLFSPSFYEV